MRRVIDCLDQSPYFFGTSAEELAGIKQRFKSHVVVAGPWHESGLSKRLTWELLDGAT